MTDLRTLLTEAAGGHADAPPRDDVLTADLARARHGLRRRTARRTAGTLTLAAVAVTGVAVVAGSGSHPAPPAAAPPATSPAVRRPPVTPVAQGHEIVAYAGRQPSGYRVGFVPKGWEIQGANAFRMTIAAIGSPDRHPDSFTGKLVVMLRSVDDTGAPVGTPVRVGDGTGYVNRADTSTAVLTFQDSAKHWVVVQVPSSLHWSDTDIAHFADGIEVTHNAEPGRG